LHDLKDDRLLATIREEAAKRRIEPIDARVDRVWKAIPGYNGLEVDIEQTYRLTRSSGSLDNIRYVYRETAPNVQLEELGPHPIYKGNPHKPMVSLMINVAWGNEHLEPILNTLDDENVKATFFLDGSWLSKNVELAKEIQKRGHELANHAYSHPNMSQLSRERQRLEMVKTQTLLRDLLGVDNALFAPPSGDYNDLTVKIAHELKMKTVLWTIDTVDWKNPGPQWIVRKITQQLEPGAMILMHPTESAKLALPDMIRNIKKQGLALGTVSQLLSPERVPGDAGPFRNSAG
jgi:probable sporulation protein (polysaccharide deacetylase family)